ACDAMLGGLARWLRAAGYDASWHDGIDDGALVRLALAEGLTVLSSDGDVSAFALLRDGVRPALFVPPVAVQEQRPHVLRRRARRGRACGGDLAEVDRGEAAGRVPPLSLARHERFWACVRCGKTFWHGSHWAGIVERLRHAAD